MKLDIQGQGSRRISDVDGQGVGEGLESWTVSMNVKCVSSLINKAVPQPVIATCEICSKLAIRTPERR